MSIAIVFPGQGSQHRGFLNALPESKSIAGTLAESQVVLESMGLNADLDSTEALADTTKVQLGLVIAGVACGRALMDEFRIKPRIVAGHSVGAFAAAVTIGALTLPEALDVVHLRGQLMKQACEGAKYGMAAIKGLATPAVSQLVDQCTTPENPLWIANYNTATQTVLSGTVQALKIAEAAAHTCGASAFELLDVPTASHCPLQDATAAGLAVRLASVLRRKLTAGYITNTGGRRVSNPEAVLDDLAQSVAQPVRWHTGARLLPELGITCAIETAPGHVLTNLLTSSVPSMSSIAISTVGLPTAASRAAGSSRL